MLACTGGESGRRSGFRFTESGDAAVGHELINALIRSLNVANDVRDTRAIREVARAIIAVMRRDTRERDELIGEVLEQKEE